MPNFFGLKKSRKRITYFILLIIISFIALSFFINPAYAQTQPNVVVILADDLDEALFNH